MTPKEKFTKARAGLILDQPFFGSLAMRLKIVEDPTCKTAYTDGVTLGYNPQFVESLPLDELKGLIAHEVMHCALAHQARRNGRDPYKWNVAGDLAINPILEKAGIHLPPGRLLDPDAMDLSADEHYARGKADPEGEESQEQNQKENGEEGDDEAPGQGNGEGDEGDNQPGQTQPGQGKGKDKNPDPGGCGEVRDTPDPSGQGGAASEADKSRQEQEWKIAAKQAAQQAKAMGQLPGELERLVEEILQPRVDWKEVLRRFIDQTAKADYTWSRPNRRFIAEGLYLPSVHSESLPPIAVAVDTSCSIDDVAIAQFAAELTAILEDYHTECEVIYCDTHVQNTEHFSSDDLPLELHPGGGGGTDFRPPFKYVEEHPEITPSCLIYLTDMECWRFPEEPEYPVLWVRYGKGGEKPPFGEMVDID